MQIIKTGITRIVFILGNWAIKIPNYRYGWQNFLKGLLANISENETWKWNTGKYRSKISELLCPVIWCSWGGWIIIMAKVDVKTHEDEMEQEMKYIPDNDGGVQRRIFLNKYYSNFIENNLGGDDKPDNYGYMGSRLVKIDYS